MKLFTAIALPTTQFLPHNSHYTIPTTPFPPHNSYHTTSAMDSPRAYGPPPPEAVYTDLDTAIAAIQGHAKCNGYALCRGDRKARRIVYTCDRYGKPQDKTKSSTVHTTKRRPGSGSKKCGCTMRLELKQDVVSSH